jgi:glucose 1-dehydrogenase
MSRTALITGAARGIGAATAALMGSQGWRVLALDRDWPQGEPKGSLSLDVGDHDALRDAVAGLGEFDALINNAAVMAEEALTELEPRDLSRTLHVNLSAAVLATAAAIPGLEARRGGVVNVASVHGLASRGGMAAYAAAKGGLLAFTRAAAVELGPQGIRVNAVVPGAVETGMLLPQASADQRRAGLERLAAQTPLGRVGDPREIAAAIAFLADSERAGFITGEALVVDGGALARLATE